MTRLIRTTSLLSTAFAFLLLLPAAQGDGCGNDDVIIGDDGDDGGNTGSGGGGGNGAVACFIGGCSGQLCTSDPNAASTCEWTAAYACYQQLGICEADENDQCGWRQTQELLDCIDNANGVGRTPIEGGCIRDHDDTCVTDADCVAGGCGGEVCYNPAVSGGESTCDCTTPAVTGCGCVMGECTWYN